MPVRRRRRRGGDHLVVTTEAGLPLGHLDLGTRSTHDVPRHERETFRREVDGWLFRHGLPPLSTPAVTPGPGRHRLPAVVSVPEQGWAPDEDLATHLPAHGLVTEAWRAHLESGQGADRPHRLHVDGRHAVADALVKLASPGLRRDARWRLLHGVALAFEGTELLLDHLVLGPSGVFVVEVAHHPGGHVAAGPESLEIDRRRIDLELRRRVAQEVEDRLAAGLARAAGAEATLNPPPVTPVVAVVGAVVGGTDRPRGVLVSRVGHLPRLLQACGPRLTDAAVRQSFVVARRASTWL